MSQTTSFLGLGSLGTTIILLALQFLSGSLTTFSEAATPGWVTALRSAPVPDYGPDVSAVCLFDDGSIRLTKEGEFKGSYRTAYKILTQDGLDLAWLRLPFHSESKVSNLKAWNLKADGVVHETIQKDAIETQLSGSSVLFQDRKSLLLFIPQVDVGSIIAFEFERHKRPIILQDQWFFQQRYPVLRSRFELELPPRWEFDYRLSRHSPVEPVTAGENKWLWELTDLPGIPDEEGTPPLAHLAAKLMVSYFPPADQKSLAPTLNEWDDVAQWISTLSKERTTPSPEITEKARQLAEPRSISEFVQKQIRYVAIEIGIGGYQPHFANETFLNRYGDCKDKVTLLHSMMNTQDYKLYPVLIHTERQSLEEGLPSPLAFNHMIAALQLSESERAGPSTIDHPQLGRLMLFDPTDTRTPIGRLPPWLQGTTAILIDGEKGFVIQTPVTAPAYNRLMRTGTFELSPTGELSGTLIELYRGDPAARQRARLMAQEQRHWLRDAYQKVADWMPGVRIKTFGVGGLESDGSIQENYEMEAPHAVQNAGNLLMFRPGFLGEEIIRIASSEARKYDYHFSKLRLHTQRFTFLIPEGYVAEKLPQPLEFDLPFARYRMQLQKEGQTVQYASDYEIKELSVPAGEVDQLREFYDFVERASQTIVLLERIAPGPE